MTSRTDGLTIVRSDDVAPQPWKNGGGVTRELLRLPLPGGAPDDWLLRVSLADIEADGPFSPFPGITRWFAVIEGAGVRLSWPDERADRVMTPATPPLRFDGADAPGCALVDGRTRDLNVMVRADAGVDAVLEPASTRDELRARRTSGFGFFALEPVRLHGPCEEPVRLEAMTLLWKTPPFGPTRPWGIESLRAPAGDRAHTAQVPGYWFSLHPPRR